MRKIVLSALFLVSCTGPVGEQGAKGDRGGVGAKGVPGDNTGGAGGSTSTTGGGAPSCDAGCCSDADCPATGNDCSVGACVAGACQEVGRPFAWPCAGQDFCEGTTCACTSEGRCFNVIACDVGGTVYRCDGFLQDGTDILFEHGNTGCSHSQLMTDGCPAGDPCQVTIGADPPIDGTCL